MTTAPKAGSGPRARTLLERESSPDDEAAFTAHYAQKRSAKAGDYASVLIFRLGVEWLALPMRVVDEVLELRPTHSLPQRKNGVVLGVTSVRGQLLVYVSLARILAAEELSETRPEGSRATSTRMLVLSRGNRRFVSRVDEVHGKHVLARDALTRSPATVTKAPSNYAPAVFPWADKFVGYLDDELLFYSIERSLS